MRKKILLMLCVMAFVSCFFALTAFAEVVAIDGIWYDLNSNTGTAQVTNDNATQCTLTEVVIPESVEYNGNTYDVTSIANHAFSGAQNSWGKNQTITSLTIPASVTSIGDHILRECGSVKTVVVKAKATQLYDAAFYKCTGLESVDLSESSINSFGKGYTFTGCTKLVSVKIPLDTNMKTLPTEIFKGCSSLKTVELPDTIETIASWAFNGCSSLESLKLPTSLKSIGNNCIQGTKLTSIILPPSCTTMAADVFPSSPISFMILPAIDESDNFDGGFLHNIAPKVIIYAGDNYQWLIENKYDLRNYDAQPFSEYDSGKTYSKNTIFYGATTCDKCNGLLGDKGFIYKDLLTEMKYGQACTHCAKENITETYAPVFVDLGYSTYNVGGSCSILQGFKIDYDSVAIYNENFVDAQIGEFGVLAVAAKNVDTVAFDENGEALDGVLDYAIQTGLNYFDIRVIGIPENGMLDENTAYVDAKLHMCAYVYVGDTIYYITEGYAGSVLGASVSYNDKVAQ